MISCYFFARRDVMLHHLFFMMVGILHWYLSGSFTCYFGILDTISIF